MRRTLLIGSLSVSLLTLVGHDAAAWNKAGHMVSGAIAYAELARNDPETLDRVLEILQQHPHFESRWEPRMDDLGLEDENRDLYLFMAAARWPDDIRGDEEFDRGNWHYVNFRYRPGEDAPGDPPSGENILTAFATNMDILRSDEDDSEKAIALCWIFHLTGDVQQPLHSTTLVSDRFTRGDRGGTRFYVRVRSRRRTISLHKFWDDLVLGSTRFRRVRNTATDLRLRDSHARDRLPELSETRFEEWAKTEGFEIAKEHAYRNGELRGSRDRRNGAILPEDYRARTKPIAERRMVLAGYRLADLLSDLEDL